MTVRLSLLQFAPTAGKPDANRDRAEAAIREAAADGADLVALPELWDVGYFAFEAYARNGQSVAGGAVSHLADLADELDVAIQAGSVVEDLAASAADGVDVPAEEGYANASVFLDRDGERRAVYRKQHLFGYDSAETGLLTPGDTLPTVEFEGFTVGMTTCYDLRFPELYRELVDAGADLVLVPSAWPYPRVEHWTALPKARAIENLSYVATINGAGSMEGETLVGRSTVYDPWGTPVATCGDEPTTVTTEIDPARVASVREEFPALRDRRLGE